MTTKRLKQNSLFVVGLEVETRTRPFAFLVLVYYRPHLFFYRVLCQLALLFFIHVLVFLGGANGDFYLPWIYCSLVSIVFGVSKPVLTFRERLGPSSLLLLQSSNLLLVLKVYSSFLSNVMSRFLVPYGLFHFDQVKRNEPLILSSCFLLKYFIPYDLRV